MWRVLTNCLVVRRNLHRRNMDVPLGCPMCGMEEDIEHVIFKCRWTGVVWLGSLGLMDGNQNKDTIEEWIPDRRTEQMSNNARKEDRWHLCMWTCWLIGEVDARLSSNKPC